MDRFTAHAEPASRDARLTNSFHLLLLIGLLAFSPLLEGGTTHVAVMVIRLLIVGGLCVTFLQGIQTGRLAVPSSPLWLAVWMFLGLAVITTVRSPYLNQSLQWLIILLSYAMLLYWLQTWLVRWERAALLLLVFVGMGTLEAGWALAQVWQGNERPTGTFFNPNFLAGYLAAGWCLGLGTLCYVRIGRRRLTERTRRIVPAMLGGIALLSLFLAVIVSTGSRGGLIALLAGSALVAGARFGVKASGALAAVVVAAVLTIPNPAAERIRAEHLANPVGYARWQMWESALRVIGDHPLGIGPGLYQYVYPRYAFPVESQIARYGKVARTPHNEYLQMGVEMGLLSLPVFAWGVGLVGRAAIAALRRRLHRWQRGLVVGTSGAVVTMLVHAAVDSNLHEPALAIALTLCTAVILSAANLAASTVLPERSLRVSRRWLWATLGLALAAILAAGILRMGLAWVAYAQGFAAAERKDLPRAVELYRTAVGLDSGKALYHSALAMASTQAFEKAGELAQAQEAVREYERAMVLNPVDGRLAGQLAHVYAMIADASGAGHGGSSESDDRTLYRQRALAAYEQGLRLEPFNPFYRLEAARLHAMLGEHERAVMLVREAVELEPNFLGGRAWLVRRHVKTGNLEAAKQEYADLLARRSRYATWPKDGYDTRLLAADVEGLAALLQARGVGS